MSCVWLQTDQRLTDCVADRVMAISDTASERDVQVFEASNHTHKARVSASDRSSLTGCVEVWVDVENHKTKCPRRHTEECGICCVHVKALLWQLGTFGMESSWVHERCHVCNHSEACGATIPGMALAGELVAGANVALLRSTRVG